VAERKNSSWRFLRCLLGQAAGLPQREQDSLIEFLRSLQVLAPGSKTLIVDERGQPRALPSISVN